MRLLKRRLLRSELGLKQDDCLLLSVGELSPRKNQAPIVKALAMLPGKVHLAVCGTGSERDALINLGERLGVSDRLHLLGFRPDIPEVMVASDALVFPSLQEGLPVAVMEAMASGLPVIATDIRGIRPDLLADHENGLILRDGSATAIADAVTELMHDDRLGFRLAFEALGSVRGFNLAEVRPLLSNIYAALSRSANAAIA